MLPMIYADAAESEPSGGDPAEAKGASKPVDFYRKLATPAVAEVAARPDGTATICKLSQAMADVDPINTYLCRSLAELVPIYIHPLDEEAMDLLTQILSVVALSVDHDARQSAFDAFQKIITATLAAASDFLRSPIYLYITQLITDDKPYAKAAKIELNCMLLIALFQLNETSKEINAAKRMLTRRFFESCESAAYTIEKKRLAVFAPQLMAGWLEDESCEESYLADYAEEYPDALDETDMNLTCAEKLILHIPEYFLRSTQRPDECKWGLELILITLCHLFNRHVLPNLKEVLEAQHRNLRGIQMYQEQRLDAVDLPEPFDGCSRCNFVWPEQSNPADVFDLKRLVDRLSPPLIRQRGKGAISAYETIIRQWAWSYLKRLGSTDGVVKESFIMFLPLIIELVLNYTVVTTAVDFFNSYIFTTDNTNVACRLATLENMSLNAFSLAHTRVSRVVAFEQLKDDSALTIHQISGACSFNYILHPVLELVRVSLQSTVTQIQLRAAIVAVQLMLLAEDEDTVENLLIPIIHSCLTDRNLHIVLATIGAFRAFTVDITAEDSKRRIPPTGAISIIGGRQLRILTQVRRLLLGSLSKRICVCLTAMSTFQPSGEPGQEPIQIPWWRVRVGTLHVLEAITLLEDGSSELINKDLLNTIHQVVDDATAAVRDCAPRAIVRIAKNIPNLQTQLLMPLTAYSPEQPIRRRLVPVMLGEAIAAEQIELSESLAEALQATLMKAVSDPRRQISSRALEVISQLHIGS